MKYPSTWVRQEKGSIITDDVARFSIPSTSSSNSILPEVTVEIQELKQPISLQDYSNSKVNEIRQFLTNAQISEVHKTTLAMLPAQELVYSGKEERYTLKRKAVLTIKNNKAYIITYTAEESQYKEFLQAAQVIINSLELFSTR
jgi:hypothetical protein